LSALELANSPLVFFMCLIPVGVIVFQAVKLLTMAYSQGIQLGMKREDLNRCIRASVSISIIPPLQLVALMIALAPMIGKYFPWLRLSNIGAGAYENIAAELARNTLGVEYSALEPAGLLVIFMTMNLGMLLGQVVSLVALKGYDRTLKRQRKAHPFLMAATAAAFLGILARITVPYLVNWNTKLPVLSCLIGAGVMAACQVLGKKRPFLRDFSLTLAIVAAAGLCILAAWLGLK